MTYANKRILNMSKKKTFRSDVILKEEFSTKIRSYLHDTRIMKKERGLRYRLFKLQVCIQDTLDKICS